MNPTTTTPEPPDDPEKKNGPTHRDNDTKDQVSENARQKDASEPEEHQAPVVGEHPSIDYSLGELSVSDFDALLEYEHEQGIIDNVLSNGGTLDEAHEILHNLWWYGSPYSPEDCLDDDNVPDASEFLRAVCVDLCVD